VFRYFCDHCNNLEELTHTPNPLVHVSLRGYGEEVRAVAGTVNKKFCYEIESIFH